jgi:hypothetical protein
VNGSAGNQKPRYGSVSRGSPRSARSSRSWRSHSAHRSRFESDSRGSHRPPPKAAHRSVLQSPPTAVPGVSRRRTSFFVLSGLKRTGAAPLTGPAIYGSCGTAPAPTRTTDVVPERNAATSAGAIGVGRERSCVLDGGGAVSVLLRPQRGGGEHRDGAPLDESRSAVEAGSHVCRVQDGAVKAALLRLLQHRRRQPASDAATTRRRLDKHAVDRGHAGRPGE